MANSFYPFLRPVPSILEMISRGLVSFNTDITTTNLSWIIFGVFSVLNSTDIPEVYEALTWVSSFTCPSSLREILNAWLPVEWMKMLSIILAQDWSKNRWLCVSFKTENWSWENSFGMKFYWGRLLTNGRTH